MLLAEIKTATVQRAVDLFLEAAYPDEAETHRPKLHYEAAASAEDLVGQFVDESHYTENELSHRYVLRLGNHAYPHMKLVLEEFFILGEFFFTVDSHDGMVKLRTTSPDYQAWEQVRRANGAIKKKIERRWQEEGVPTFKDLRKLVGSNGDTSSKPKGKVLIIEDELDVAETTRAILTVHGFDVDVASDGYEGLKKIAADKPDVVLLDIMLPGMDGYEVCSKIKADEKTKDVPVLLVTAGTGEMIATRQADGFLVKPFKQDVLLSFIHHLLHPAAPDAEEA